MLIIAVCASYSLIFSNFTNKLTQNPIKEPASKNLRFWPDCFAPDQIHHKSPQSYISATITVRITGTSDWL